MIEGLKLDFTSEELKQHLNKKVKYHRERSRFYGEKAQALHEGGAEAAQFSGGDPVRALKDKQLDHNKRAELFEIYSSHLVNDTYRLSDSDLTRIELVSRYF